jgi:peptidoglycan hydrolase CwlO-like protein
MKKSILTIALLAFMVGTVSISYGQNPVNKSVTASGAIKETQKDGNSEFQKFRKESEIKIKSIDNSIGDLKVFFYQNKVKNKDAFQNNLNLMEQKNDSLKAKLAGYKNDQNTMTAFKLEISNAMAELGKSLKDFRTKNK